ncbi:MAG TPA: ABC transporter ATP-binding protein [Myxococcota bacterium]|nr:ABC transporter ATP-binding protein [Myxococcota bacterium]
MPDSPRKPPPPDTGPMPAVRRARAPTGEFRGVVRATGEHRVPVAARTVEKPILTVEGLKTYFDTEDGVLKAVDGASFALRRGMTLGLVGESGCGKSVTNLSIMGLVPTPPGRIAGGQILFHGEDLLKKTEDEKRAIRGRQISMIFQDPMTSLNPYLRVSRQITEVLELHLGLGRAAARARALELLEQCGIPDAAARMDDYPHQFSGGMRQRVMIAMALACRPEVLLADEPTTALDVTIQAQILELIRKMQQEMGTAVVLVTHDLGVVAGMADEVAVMYAGRIVEHGSARDLFKHPTHPYTQALLGSVPRLDQKGRLRPVDGQPPDLTQLGADCSFRPRCEFAEERCVAYPPTFEVRHATTGSGRFSHRDLGPSAVSHRVACWRADARPEAGRKTGPTGPAALPPASAPAAPAAPAAPSTPSPADEGGGAR